MTDQKVVGMEASHASAKCRQNGTHTRFCESTLFKR